MARRLLSVFRPRRAHEMRIRENHTSALSENHYAVCSSVVVVFFYNFRKAVTTEADVCWPACPPGDISRRRFLPVHQRAPSWLTHVDIGLGNPRALPKLRRLCFPGAFRNGLVPLDPLTPPPPAPPAPSHLLNYHPSCPALRKHILCLGSCTPLPLRLRIPARERWP